MTENEALSVCKVLCEKVIIVAELLRLRMKQRDNKVCKSASGSFNQ